MTLHLTHVRAPRFHLGLALRGGASNLVVMVMMMEYDDHVHLPVVVKIVVEVVTEEEGHEWQSSE